PVDLFTVAACESRVNPDSVSSYFSSSNRRYWGMYQYQSSGTAYSGGLFSSNASRLGFNPNVWNDARAQINVTAFIVSNEGSWNRWGCKP
ncbi:hypothetical protein K0A96_02880, partial [Patescibacteria group bacterium]|nr:hypothetical protein [Patescibacteria group bacterium]